MHYTKACLILTELNMKKPNQCLTYHEAATVKKQHVKPCSDCPFARTALAGWLGGMSVGKWLAVAHGDGRMECHTRNLHDGSACECAGGAIFRSNVCKSVTGDRLRLKADKARVLASDVEFARHHLQIPITADRVWKMKMQARFEFMNLILP